MKRRVLSMILALALTLGVLSCAVFAEEAAPALTPDSAKAEFEQSVQTLGNTILSCTRNILTQTGLSAMTGTMLLASEATQKVAQWSVDYYQKQLDAKQPALTAAKAELDELDSAIKQANAILKNRWAKQEDKEAATKLLEEKTPLQEAKSAEVEALQAAYDQVDLRLNGNAVDVLVRSFLVGDLKDSAQAFIKFGVDILFGRITKAEITDAYNQSTSLLKALAAFAAIGRGEVNQENVQTIVNAIRSLKVPVATRKVIIDKIVEYMTFAHQTAKTALGEAFSGLKAIPGDLLQIGKSFGNVIIAGVNAR